MKFLTFRLIILILTIFTDLSTNSQDGWSRLNTGFTVGLQTVFFINVDTGWIGGLEAGNGQILRTTNGGTTWQVQYFAGMNASITSIFFSNNATGYAVGSQNAVSLVLKTTNQGSTWIQQNPGVGTIFYSVYFRPNTDTGWVVGNNGYIIKTTNGGINWIQKNSGTPLSLLCISHPYPNKGWIGKSGNTVLFSSDAGETWVQQSIGISGEIWAAESQICCNGVGWFMGGTQAGSPIVKTTNFGLNWVQLTMPLFNKNSMYFTNENSGWIAGQNLNGAAAIYFTSNGGSNWTSQVTAIYQYILTSIYFVNNLTGYTVGAGGLILKTTNGGITAINPISTEIPDNFALYQNYPNPFNPVTNIKFSLAHSGFVTLKIYNDLGKEEDVLVNENLVPGIYKIDFDASQLASGVYFYRLTAGNFFDSKKMVYIK